MGIEQRIDELTKAGWGVMDSDFDPVAFQNWRLKAFECLTAMSGPDHVYTKYFERFVKQGQKTNVLAAGGVLVAAKEQIKGASSKLNDFGSVSRLTERTGAPMTR